MKKRLLSTAYRLLSKFRARVTYLQALVMAEALKDALQERDREVISERDSLVMENGQSLVMGKDEYERMCASMTWTRGREPKA